MRRLFFSTLPVVVVGVVFMLASPVARAQQHDHPADAATAHDCACCGNSGSTAMNHADGTAMHHDAATGCCAGMAASATATDHAAMNHDPAAQDMPAMKHADGGCCGMAMKMDHAAAKADAAPMNHDAGMRCCANTTMDHTAANAAKPDAMFMDAASGCSAVAATDVAINSATDVVAATDAVADTSAGGCCAGMSKMHDSAK